MSFRSIVHILQTISWLTTLYPKTGITCCSKLLAILGADSAYKDCDIIMSLNKRRDRAERIEHEDGTKSKLIFDIA